MSGATRRRVIVTADDFGRSPAVNEAVARAHGEGILTAASLMVNEPHCPSAVEWARRQASFGVGLHLVLVRGRAACDHRRIPGLADAQGQFGSNPFALGWRYYFQRDLREQLRAEVRAQLARFQETGLRLDHVNGHLHFHLHPVVLRILVEEARGFGIRHLRLTRDPFWLNLRLARGRLGYRAFHAGVFAALSKRARPRLARAGIRHVDRVFGLLQDGRVDEEFISRLLPQLPAGDSELYLHPSLDEFRPEFEALISPRVRRRAADLGIELVRYQDV
jgi:hopanoid biosynthesis associated protein HpnK